MKLLIEPWEDIEEMDGIEYHISRKVIQYEPSDGSQYEIYGDNRVVFERIKELHCTSCYPYDVRINDLLAKGLEIARGKNPELYADVISITVPEEYNSYLYHK